MDNPVGEGLDLRPPPRRRFEAVRTPWSTLAAVSAGGMLGAVARYGLGVAFPHAPGAFPLTTFAINLLGCLLIGVLMVLITEGPPAHRLVRPFLGVGVLGGFTTFSTYAVDIQRAVSEGAPRTALLYLAATLAGALLAVYTGVTATRVALLYVQNVRSRRRDGTTGERP